MIGSEEDLISHVAAHAGVFADRAARAVHAVLAGLGAYLGEADRQLVGSELPPAIGAALHAGGGLATPIEERVREPGSTAGEAWELVASVCRVLAEELSAEAVAAVRDRAPASIAALLAAPGRDAPRHAAPAAHRDTLAAGRPGSRHPVSEAPASRAQTGSVAGEANPHGATKLSSTPGSTQERRHETLAEGHPGADHPLTGSRR